MIGVCGREKSRLTKKKRKQRKNGKQEKDRDTWKITYSIFYYRLTLGFHMFSGFSGAGMFTSKKRKQCVNRQFNSLN